MSSVQFALLREGPSDDGLVVHIRELLARSGLDSVSGDARNYKGSMRQRLAIVAKELPRPDLIFVHRDSDRRDSGPRHAEIRQAAQAQGVLEIVVPVVPVQELEAWLLTSEQAIREVVGKPRGRVQLGLPGVAHIESCAGAKERLQAACRLASEASGARLAKEAKSFGLRRAILLERLDIDGPVRDLPSWRRFEVDVETAARRLMG